MLKSITVHDTAVGTDNLGDDIIMAAVMKELKELFPNDFYYHVPTHDNFGKVSRRWARKSKLSFVGGTNLLSAFWPLKSQWKVGVNDFWQMGSPILCGVGWINYQRATDPLTKMMFKRLLSKTYLHSVRDSYTCERVKKMGIHNVINTGCPTMWRLTPEHCQTIVNQKCPNALITVTAYRKTPQLDKAWITHVLDNYETVYFWPQMMEDLAYVQDIVGTDRLTIVDPNIEDYNSALLNNNVDYIGTRLHGGVRALQLGRRALIIEVDNRAKEIAKDTGLPTVKHDDPERIKQWINTPEPVKISMPWDVIDKWRGQFKTTP